jgi:hypothetical protein
MAQTNQTIRDELTATTDATAVFKYRRASTPYSTVRVMLYGTWVGTVTLQTSDPDRNVWVDEDAWTANGAAVFEPGGDCDIRWYFTSRTSGTAIGAIINAS